MELLTIPGIEKRIAKPSDFFILSNAKIPVVLVEVGYLSNPEERKKLLNNDYQTLLAEKISRGIQKFFMMEIPVKTKPTSSYNLWVILLYAQHGRHL